MNHAKTRLLAGIAALVLCATAVSPLSASADYGVGGNGTAIMEYLDRGIYSVKSGNGQFVSWRWNANDDDNAEFRLYRDDELIYTSQAGSGATCYQDNGGQPTSKYRVETVVNGEVVANDTCKMNSGSGYFDIRLKSPGSQYSPNDCCVGDVNGDGVYEIFLKWDPNNSQDNSKVGYTDNVFIDCYTLTGQQLWRIDLGRNIRAGQHYTQMCVADFDCDGKAELITKTGDGTKDGKGTVIGNGSADYRNSDGIILTGPEYLSLFDGQTGAVLDTINYPIERGVVTKETWGDNYGNRVDRMNGAIAYLDGVHPSAIYGRGYYTRLTLSAFDVVNKKLQKRWVFDTGFDRNAPGFGCGNHNVMVADSDNDGKQEIFMGACAIDDNGKLLWTTGLMHGDAMHLGDLVPDRPGQELWICHEDGNYGVSLVDAKNGQIIFHYDGDKDTGRCCADNVWAGNPGAEFWGSRPAGAVFNSKGDTIATKQPSQNFLIYWDGDLERELLDNITITKMTGQNKIESIFTAEGCASNNSTKAVPCMTADLFGDWREELVLRTEDNTKLRIWCTTTPTEYRITTLMHDMQYRMQNCCQQSSYNQPPHTSYYLASDAPLPARPNIKLNKAEPVSVNGKYIKNMTVKDIANQGSWILSEQPAAVGSRVFGDRDYTYTSLSDALIGSEVIETACNSKNTNADLAEFTAAENITAYVLLDTRVETNGAVPSWLSGWQKTDMSAASSNDVTFSIYAHECNKGDVIELGTNNMTGNVVNYTVMVNAAKPVVTTTPEPVVTTTSEEAITTTEPPAATEEPVTTAEASSVSKRRGDVDCNGIVDVSDAVLLARYNVGDDEIIISDQGLINGDVNNDGKHTSDDLNAILSHIVGLSEL